MSQAIEITTFRLASGLTINEFITANSDIDPWLRKQPGFVSRHICERDDGFVVDMLVWEAAEAGHRAANGVTTEMAASPVHASIDQSTVEWTIATVRHSFNCDGSTW
ncbi:hypothetical protein FPV16_15625 [Methylobacterium sp. W2]|uniref:hypothetical protein n=1 Tax=Methylobacterium sp. W2 TaxID=2598107 RepID=UPI001D0CC8A2|nr:hypothetical protein [Methylobacterium sp. W2]MCC0807643.1 hypothetical protein [Methylobacterium sp. W2]